jgi:hypothetical protein
MRWWIYFTIICNLFLTSLAFANLGSTESASTTQYNRYRVHESSKNWVKVHEFSGSDGKVFALAWSGKKHPDLQTLLGAHLVDFQTAITRARKEHPHGGSVSITVNNLHVEMGGHMGAVYGQTWLTDQVPAGMDVHEIK